MPRSEPGDVTTNADFNVWRACAEPNPVTTSIELKAAESFVLTKRTAERRWCWGGHGKTRSVNIMRQLIRSGAAILLFSWTEPTTTPDGRPAEELWFKAIEVATLTRPQKDVLRKKCLKRTRAQLEAVFPESPATRQGLKAAVAALLPRVL